MAGGTPLHTIQTHALEFSGAHPFGLCRCGFGRCVFGYRGALHPPIRCGQSFLTQS